MKASRRNLANANARAEKRAQGKPPLSKYEAKRRGYAEEAPKSLTGVWAVDFGGADQ